MSRCSINSFNPKLVLRAREGKRQGGRGGLREGGVDGGEGDVADAEARDGDVVALHDAADGARPVGGTERGALARAAVPAYQDQAELDTHL